MKTVVRRVLLMSALMSPGALYALGLGEIKLNSALNQPFDADIELISATQEDLSALRAALAPSDTFARYGLDRPAYLSDFSFRVAKGADGRDVLRVTSPRPVTEPFVTLLVEANWPRGRLLREYTVLLDPPVFAPATSAPAPAVAAPRVSSGGATSSRATEPLATDAAAPAGSAGVDAPAPAPAPRQAAEPRAAVATRAIEPGSSYRVRPNDTLWNIASAAHPGRRSDVNRAMVAIYQQNPSAFDGNINILRSGSTLRIPESSQVEAISASAAAAEVARQYDAWRNGAATPATGAAADSARLRLVPPEQGTAAPSTAVASTTAAAATAGTPSAASGSAATTPADADIEARIRRLESELAEAKRLLEVRNAELASLQGQSAAATGEAPAATPAGAPEAAAPAADTATTAPAATPAPEAAPAPAQPEPPAAAPPAEPEGPSLFERLRAFWWVPLALLAAALAAYLFRRMRKERGEAEENLEAALSQRDLRAPGPAATPTYTPRSRENSIVVEEKRPVDTRAPVAPAAVAATVAAAPTPSLKPVRIDDTLSGEAPASLESGDPLAEADFHMAYGLYDQAADLVELAIKREPLRRDLKLKLLEIFFVWGNRNRFLDVARDLDASRSDAPAGEWDKVLIMGKQIAPDDRLFGGTPSTTPESLDMELHSASAALDLDVGGTTSIRPATDLDLTEKTPRVDSSGLDFVFDESMPGLDSASTSPTVETPRPADAGSVAPTVETPRVKMESGGDTQELTVDRLGLDVEAVRSLEALDSDDSLSIPRPVKVEDTVETPAAPRGGRSLLDEDRDGTDLLNSTALMRMAENTPLGEAAEGDEAVVDLSDVTGEMPGLDFPLSEAGIKPTARNYDSFEQPTQSEVGTKLDLARAYMDMGDPEGARSILEEVLQEGNPTQQQEARRLISSLPA